MIDSWLLKFSSKETKMNVHSGYNAKYIQQLDVMFNLECWNDNNNGHFLIHKNPALPNFRETQ